MLHAVTATGGMVTAPHHLAAQAGAAVLREGGNAIEAMLAAAATIAVVYPHHNGLGGDGFWLISAPGKPPLCIDACGASGINASAEFYHQAGRDDVPRCGPLAACTVAGTVSGWQAALEVSARWGGRLPLTRLLADAIHHARRGWAVTADQVAATERVVDELRDVPGFAEHFLVDGRVPAPGTIMRLPALAQTLALLAEEGLDSFYRGDIGRAVAAELQRVGSPLVSDDLARHRSVRRRPLSLSLPWGTVYNQPPPTQGLASLMILGLFQRLGVKEAEGFEHVHAIVEATKLAYYVRDRHICDPSYMAVHATTFLREHLLDQYAGRIDMARALPFPYDAEAGDTVWLGAIDAEGRAVSFIQSNFQPFGSGVVLADTGLLWHNRGAAFTLDRASRRALSPRRKPFHTLNPALAHLKDGRVMAYGTSGADGQPQTQAAVFSRHVAFGQDLQAAVTAPRWALGRGWTGPATDLKLESRFDPAVVEALRAAGHEVTLVQPFDRIMGHAGAVVRHPSGLLEGASDPRSDGGVAAL